MYKKYILVLFFWGVWASVCHSNDAVVYGSGSTLTPTRETSIELRKEVLTLRFIDDNLFVDVDFTFYNPREAHELTVGFITPPTYDPESYESPVSEREPSIHDFTVDVNGTPLHYEKAILQDSDFDFLKSRRDGETFIYYFDMTFQKGLNSVRHTYSFRGGYSSMGERFFDYILSTGTYWATGRIEDFTLNIDMGNDAFFSINTSFTGNSNLGWKIVGTGRQQNAQFYIDHGHISYHATGFVPQDELSFSYYPGKIDMYTHYLMYDADKSELMQMDKTELRILRNTFFALKGYAFKDEELRTHFSDYVWYIANPSLTSEGIYNQYPETTRQRIDLIRLVEQSKP